MGKQTKMPQSLSATLIKSFLALSMTVLLIEGVFQIYVNFKAQQQIVLMDQQRIAQKAAHAVETFIQHKFNIMESAVQFGYPSTAPLKKRQSVLDTLLGMDLSFRNIVYLNSKNQVKTMASRQPQYLSQAFIRRMDFSQFDRLKQTGRLISSVSIDERTNEPKVTMAISITNVFGDFSGILAAEVNLKFMWELVGKQNHSETGHTYVVDKKGYLLAAADVARVLKRENLKQINKVHDFVHGDSTTVQIGTSMYQGINGSFVVGTSVLLGTPDWAVVSEIAAKEAYANVVQSIGISLGFMFLIAAATVLVGVYLARRLAAPLTSLTQTASQIAGGKKGLTAPVNGPKEIALLADTFNTMTQRLSKLLSIEESRAQELHQEVERRKKMGHALKESEEKHRNLFEASRDAILVLDPAKGYVDCNPAALEMFGFSSKSDFLKMTPVDLSPQVQPNGATSAEMAKKMIAQALQKGSHFFEFSHQRSDGTVFPATVLATKMNWGNRTLLQGTIRDITLRKQAESRLKRAQNYIVNIIDSMPSILIGVDINGTVTQWNRAAYGATGVRPSDAVGQSLKTVFPRLADEIENVHRAIINQEEWTDKKRARTEAGETFYEDVTIYPLMADGVDGAVIRIDNTTETVRISEMIVQNEKMVSIGGLAAGMAHEINNPLGGMMQTANLIQERLSNVDMPANLRAAKAAGTSMESISTFMEARGIFQMLTQIVASGMRAANIVSNVLSFSRKSTGVVTNQNIAKLLDQSIDLAESDYDLKKEYDFRQIEIVRLYDNNLPLVPCDAAKIQQVLLNLLRNGAEAMREATPTPTPTGNRKPCFVLRLFVDKTTGMLRIDIQDNGPGMDEHIQKRVFEPFFTTKPPDKGTGLGLSVSYFIIAEEHSGEMSVASRPGEGTTFTIQLPVAQTA